MGLNHKQLLKSGFGVVVGSGLGVVVGSGIGVLISGQHVFVESGVHVVADVTVDISGTPVTISGDHVFVESGVHVVADVTVDISGTPVTISGDHVFVESGAFVTIESGIGVTAAVTVESGLGVLISGQHVYVESGIHAAIPTLLRTRPLFHIQSVATQMVSSGSIVYVTVKNLGTHQASGASMWVGGDNTVHSGMGLLLDESESIDIGVDNLEKIWLWASTSGNYISYLEQNV